eukprot:Plantae.Rhodophyta-Purpureofilum_apyrenoidigerum.ctg1286.p1 GENE.Plantae.Rhodophyta-Purpureofilum_apyrenoidigerum.ctg1286~~Plantae.Rhodophyta-Purpureofilum_apyrenoidigerum.ctg1286.p1  ORF type:complete len:323 (+),score=43.67 Plantae.Rhodophyta-Purpureofilum_apyrenoidigerum.ctg1286:108-1076(+)
MAEWKGRWLDEHSKVNCVAVIGGTHGNERNGVYLQRALKNAGASGPFELIMVEANPQAVELNRRYVDCDLNRCFSQEQLERDAISPPENVERRRAQELNKLLGPKSSSTPRADIIIDLHNTTANTGVALMMHANDKFAHALGAHLQHLDPSVHICNWATGEPPFLPSVGRSGITFEVGPAPWGVVVPKLYSNSLRLLQASLAYIAAHNNALDGAAPLQSKEESIDVYMRVRDIPFPRHPAGDSLGDIAAMLHPQIHGADFGRLRLGDPIFQRWDGSDITFEGPEDGEDLTFFFANEAAYYEKNVAMTLARRKKKTVRRLMVS